MSPAMPQDIRQTNALFEQEVVAKRNIDALDRVCTANARVLPPERRWLPAARTSSSSGRAPWKR